MVSLSDYKDATERAGIGSDQSPTQFSAFNLSSVVQIDNLLKSK